MDTKSKKWNSRIGFLCFFLGVSLFLTGVMEVVSFQRWGTFSRGEIGAYLSNDYQETEAFRNFVSKRLYRFLNMACGTFTSDVYENEATTYTEDDTEYIFDTESILLEAEAVEETSVAGVRGVDINSDTSYVGRPEEMIGGTGTAYYSEKEQKEIAKNYHARMEWDKNMYYSISYQGEELYTNMEGLDWNGSADFMPDGYNFYLSYDGEKVTIRKGVETPDIYGDGVYREGTGGWYVPGYANVGVHEKWRDAKIVILMAERPILYTGNQRERYSWSENYESYYLWKSFEENIEKIKGTIAFLVIGLFFLLCYLLFRKGKQEADRRIAAFTGRILFEIKALLLLLFPVLLCVFIVCERVGTAYDAVSVDLVEGVGYYDYYGYGWDAGLLLDRLIEAPWRILLIFWLLYFFVNDARKNKKAYQNGLVAKLIAATDAKYLKLSLAVRQTKRFSVIMIFTAVLFLMSLLRLAMFLTNAYRVSRMSTLVMVILSVEGIARCVFFILLLAAEYSYQQKMQQMMMDLEKLAVQIATIKNGDYHSQNNLAFSDSELTKLAEDLNDIQSGMETALSERVKSERMKVELVANVSHDIKTPLTSIVSYIELLKQEEDLPDYVKDYVKILDQKAERLKDMVQDVFSVSKAASGQLEVKIEKIDFGKLINQTLADMQEKIENSPIKLKTELPEQEISIMADGNRMYRVLQNLLDNVLKYSLDGSRAYLSLTSDEKWATLTMKNISGQELSGAVDFTERFVRGDMSRTDGGSGLGLSIARSFTEACGGKFGMNTDADLFTVTISFQRV